MMRITVSIVISLSLSACDAPADPGREQVETEAFVAVFAQNRDFSGVIAATRSGQLIVNHAVGFGQMSSPTRPTIDSSFHIASVSKTFTAAAIRQLQSDGLLSLDDPLTRFVPDFPNGDAITVRHLLAHQSGVADYWVQSDVWDIASRPVSLGDLVAWLREKAPDFEPGSATAYSNSGYALLAAVIESASGQAYHDYLTEHVFGSLALDRTTPFASDADMRGHQPGFGESGIAPSFVYNPSLLVGAGSLQSTASDLLRWCEAFIADFQDPSTEPFLYGWGPREVEGRRWVQQTGRNPGYAAHIRAYPDEQLCIVVLSNIESQSVARIGSGVADIAIGHVPQAQLRLAYPADRSDLSAYVGRYDAGPGTVLEVRLADAGLELRGGVGQFLPLDPIGPDRFFYRQLDVEIVGHRDAEGAVTALLWGGEYPIDRLE